RRARRGRGGRRGHPGAGPGRAHRRGHPGRRDGGGLMAAGTSRVEDLRYTTYSGVRRGRLACLTAFGRQGALHALGAGRGWRGKLIPVGLIFLAFAPALIVLGVRALFASSLPQTALGQPEAITELVPYEAYYSTVSLLIMALAGITTPELVCP